MCKSNILFFCFLGEEYKVFLGGCFFLIQRDEPEGLCYDFRNNRTGGRKRPAVEEEGPWRSMDRGP